MKVTTLSALPSVKVCSGGRKKKLKASALTTEVKIAGHRPYQSALVSTAHQEHDADIVDVEQSPERKPADQRRCDDRQAEQIGCRRSIGGHWRAQSSLSAPERHCRGRR